MGQVRGVIRPAVYHGEKPDTRTRHALNIYRAAREVSGHTQDRAAEYLHIDPATLRRYETGQILPDAEMVGAMSDLYKAPALVWHHCHMLFPDIIPDIHAEDLRAAAMEFQDAQTEWTALQALANRICMDNKVTSDEITDWNKVRELAFRVAAAALALYYCNGGEKH